MASVTFRYEVPFGHRLMHHPGKCRFPHGHNYLFEITVEGPVAPVTGMVMDFSELKNFVRTFFEKFDHAFVLASQDPLVEWFKFMSMHDRDEGPAECVTPKVVVLDDHPTAENLAALLATELEGREEDGGEPAYEVTVTCWEQRDCSATSRALNSDYAPRIVESW